MRRTFHLFVRDRADELSRQRQRLQAQRVPASQGLQLLADYVQLILCGTATVDSKARVATSNPRVMGGGWVGDGWGMGWVMGGRRSRVLGTATGWMAELSYDWCTTAARLRKRYRRSSVDDEL